jgi:hypothetical protein
MILYRQDVVPTLREWGAEIYQEGTDSYESTDLSTMMELEVEFDMAISNQVFKKPKKIFLNFICIPPKILNTILRI